MTNDGDNIPHSAFRIPHFLLLLLAFGLLAYLVLPGLHWGLPSEERNRLTLGDDRNAWRAPQIPAGEKESPWEHYPNYLTGGRERTGSQPRSAFNPVRSYHPDEYVFFKSLSGMRPSQLKFFPGFFGWPALHIYIVGAALKVSSWLGLATLVPDMDFYFKNPEAMARLYEVGRIVTFIFAVGCVLVVWRAAGRLFGPAGGCAAALLLAATPLFTMNARYLTADMPMLFWISLVLIFSTHIFSGGGRRWYVLAGIALGLAAATRYQGALAAFLIAAAHWMRPNAGTTWREKKNRFFASKDLWLAAAISIAVFLVCNPYILARPGQFAQEFVGELRGSSAGLRRFLLDAVLSADTGIGLIFGAAFLAAFALALSQCDRATAFVILGLGTPAVLLCIGRPVMARYWMPVLLLPVLLLAWAFATVHRRGMELHKPGAKVVAPALLAVLIFFTAHQSLAFERVFVNPAADTRTRAGEWIAQNIPAGSTIGVVSEPWQFELPPLDERKYKIVILDPSDFPPKGFEHGGPDYIVTSDLQFPPVGLQHQPSPSEQVFWDKVHRGLSYKGVPVSPSILHTFSIAQRLEAWPSGQKFFLEFGPHDMRYANPVIVISASVQIAY